MSRCGSTKQELLVLGSSSHVALARRCGLEPRGQLAPPRLTWRSSGRALTRLVRELERDGGGRIDWCHAWTIRSAAAVASMPWGARLIAGLAVGPDRPGGQLAGRFWNKRPGLLLASSGAVQRSYESVELDSSERRILRPAVDPRHIEHSDRAALRRRWGVDADTFTVAALCEPSGWIDSWMAVEIVCRVALTGRPVRLVLPSTATGLATSRRRLRALGWKDVLIVDDAAVDPWRVVAGLDAAMLVGAADHRARPVRCASPAPGPLSLLRGGWCPVRPEPGVMPLLWAMAAGLPTIAERTAASEEILGSDCCETLIAPGDLHEATRRLLELSDDRDLAREVGDAGLAVIGERFHIDRYVQELLALYMS